MSEHAQATVCYAFIVVAMCTDAAASFFFIFILIHSVSYLDKE